MFPTTGIKTTVSSNNKVNYTKSHGVDGYIVLLIIILYTCDKSVAKTEYTSVAGELSSTMWKI